MSRRVLFIFISFQSCTFCLYQLLLHLVQPWLWLGVATCTTSRVKITADLQGEWYLTLATPLYTCWCGNRLFQGMVWDKMICVMVMYMCQYMRWWCSGNINAFQAFALGLIPGQRSEICLRQVCCRLKNKSSFIFCIKRNTLIFTFLRKKGVLKILKWNVQNGTCTVHMDSNIEHGIQSVQSYFSAQENSTSHLTNFVENPVTVPEQILQLLFT